MLRVPVVMRYNADGGFTLVEAMIAVFLLTVMMLASTRALVYIKDNSVEGVIRQEVVKLGQELVNDIRNQGYDALTAGTITMISTRHTSGFDVDFSVQRVIANVAPSTARSVVFTISWTSASNSNTKTYVTRTLVGRR